MMRACVIMLRFESRGRRPVEGYSASNGGLGERVEHWAKKGRRCTFGNLMLLFGKLVVGLGLGKFFGTTDLYSLTFTLAKYVA